MKAVSLFSGIGGFDLGAERAGIDVVAQVEIDPDCISILKRHFPKAEIFTDVKEFSAVPFKPDCIFGGFPCQDISVAGRRDGLAGERSGLWYEFHRIIAEAMPPWVVIENVAGLMSSNDGKDVQVILDALEELRYIIDIDILDSQFFSVPQRRRRVFLTCQHADSLLNKPTVSSAATIAQCLTEILALVLEEARGPFQSGLNSSDFENGRLAHLAKRRMTLFGMESAERWQTLLANLDAQDQSCQHARSVWESLNSIEEASVSRTTAGMPCGESTPPEVSAEESPSIAPSWKTILAEFLPIAKEFTTSTRESEITESKIYSCAKMMITIASYTLHLPNCSPSYLNAGRCVSTVLREFTRYARAVSESLFTEERWVRAWRDFLGEADRLHKSFGGSGNFERAEEILPLADGLRRDITPSRTTRQGVAALTATGVGTCGADDGQAQAGHLIPDVANSLSTDDRKLDATVDTYVAASLTTRPYADSAAQESKLIVQDTTHTLTAEGFDASEDGTGRGTPLVPVAFHQTFAASDYANGQFEQTEVAGPLTTSADRSRAAPLATEVHAPAIAFQERGRPEGRTVESQEDLAYSMLAPNGGDRRQENCVAYQCHGNNVGPMGTLRTGNQHVTGGVPFVFEPRIGRCDRDEPSDVVNTLKATEAGDTSDMRPVAVIPNFVGVDLTNVAEHSSQVSGTTGCEMNKGSRGQGIATEYAVRRLMPIECERLQAFPPDWTRYRADGTELKDGPRYRMLGNAVTVSVAEWIFNRMMLIERGK